MNAASVEAGLGKPMFVPVQHVPQDVKALLDEHIYRIPPPVIPETVTPSTTPPSLVHQGERQAYGTGFEVVLQVSYRTRQRLGESNPKSANLKN